MQEEFQSLISDFIAEYKAFMASSAAGNFEAMVRGLATMSSIAGSMRAVREIYPEELEKSDNVEKAETLISTKAIPAILSAR
jgi:hypothetical protein